MKSEILKKAREIKRLTTPTQAWKNLPESLGMFKDQVESFKAIHVAADNIIKNAKRLD